MTGSPLLALLHLCDSLFPLGGFAHSDGLEAATASGLLSKAADLQTWMDAILDESLGRADGPAALLAWRCFSDGQLDALQAIDDETYALRPASSGRQASRSMGARLLKTWQQLHPDSALRRLEVLAPGPVTLPVAFGVVCASVPVEERAMLEAFFYTRLAATVSSAMRLMPIGQHEAHGLLVRALARAPLVIDGVLARNAPPASFMPGLDLAAMSQQVRAFAAVPIMSAKGLVRLGVGGPVGSGKTALVDALCKRMRDKYQLAVVTNDIFTREDMEFLVRSEALAADRIVGVQTGGCPHTAIREDASMNFDAMDEMAARHPDLDLIFLESGGDNLAASFSPELVDASIYVIDVSGGDKVPRKGGPGVTRSDLLVINKIDLAPMVGASLEVMARDAKAGRGERPFVFTNIKTGQGLDQVIAWIERELLFDR